VCWRAVLLEDESGGQQAIAVFDEISKEVANVIRAINFSFLFDKMHCDVIGSNLVTGF